MAKADCRRCKYFIPYDDSWYLKEPFLSMPKDRLDDLMEEMLVMEARGAKILGLCAKRKKPVTYYTGYCRYYESKVRPLRQLTLDEVLGVRH